MYGGKGCLTFLFGTPWRFPSGFATYDHLIAKALPIYFYLASLAFLDPSPVHAFGIEG